MMLPGEPIADPNVAAYYAAYGGMRVIEVRRALVRLTWWDRLFTWDPWEPLVPSVDHTPLAPDGCLRVALTLYVGDAFHRRMLHCIEELRERAVSAR